MLYANENPQSSPAYVVGCSMLFLAASAILTALAFEHIGGYRPCPLCLQQRYAYYAAIPALFAALVLLSARRLRWSALLFGLVALAFAGNAILAGYHTGVEWKYFAGPSDCAGSAGPAVSVSDLLSGLEHETGVRCDEPALVVGGLSMAGWNVIVCLILAIGASRAAWAALLEARRHSA